MNYLCKRVFGLIRNKDDGKTDHQLYNSQVQQRQLFFTYKNSAECNRQAVSVPGFRDAAFRAYSQVDEDGILLYIFSKIGFTDRLLVDIAFAEPYGANTTNLICNWGFNGLLVEGDQRGVENTRNFFASHPDTAIVPPQIICQWVTAENANSLLEDNGLKGEIDLFSLDMDGVDYWIWNSISAISPRVVIVEAQTCFGVDRSVTVPYRPDFNRFDINPDYCGASIPALVKLGRSKGYRLVACNRFGFNLFFVKNEIGRELLPEISMEECFRYSPPGLAEKREARRNCISAYEWVEV